MPAGCKMKLVLHLRHLNTLVTNFRLQFRDSHFRSHILPPTLAKADPGPYREQASFSCFYLELPD
jgi:hypothetical protein